MAEYCDDGRFRIRRRGPWGPVDHYAPKSGKLLFLSEYDPGRFQQDRDHWGFTGLVLSTTHISRAITAGFSQSVLIVGLVPIGWSNDVDLPLQQDVNQFYIDEPISKGLQNFYRDARTTIYARGGSLITSDWDSEYGSLCTTSGFPQLSQLTSLARETQPYQSFGCNSSFDDTTCGVDDPRDQWTWLSGYGALFNWAWIKTRETYERMDLLFGHANNLGLNKLHIYVEDEYGLPDRRVDVLCDAAWAKGWLRKFVREIEQKWCCPTQTFDDEACELESSQETGIVLEV